MPDSPTVADQILGVLRESDGPLSPREVADRIESGRYGYVRQELLRLLGEGEIARPHRGLYAPLVTEQGGLPYEDAVVPPTDRVSEPEPVTIRRGDFPLWLRIDKGDDDEITVTPVRRGP